MKANKILKIIAIISGILTGVHVIIMCLFSYMISHSLRDIGSTVSSVGIIGGADGPTAIFVSKGEPITGYLMCISFAVCLITNIVSIILLLKLKKRR